MYNVSTKTFSKAQIFLVRFVKRLYIELLDTLKCKNLSHIAHNYSGCLSVPLKYIEYTCTGMPKKFLGTTPGALELPTNRFQLSKPQQHSYFSYEAHYYEALGICISKVLNSYITGQGGKFKVKKIILCFYIYFLDIFLLFFIKNMCFYHFQFVL